MTRKEGIGIVFGILAIISIIYLTPLKNLNLIEPRVDESDPKEFYDDYIKNPDGYVFVDVRPLQDYIKVHAPGSINIPLHKLYDAKFTLPKRGKTIVLICGGNRSSSVGYGYLEHYGFLNLKRIEGGIQKWQDEGLPVETASST